MAATGSGGNEVPLRLRLFFDYPPPGSPACGSCWLLLEPSQVRLVTDLISLVREKFGFSRRAKLSLFLDGALLPPTESARLVRDNDSLRVKLEELIGGDSCDKLTNSCSHASKKLKKRHWQRFETCVSESDEEEHRKWKKSKQYFEHLSTQDKNSTNVLDSGTFRKKKKTVTEKDCIAHGKSDDSISSLEKLRKSADTEKEWPTKGDKKKKARTFDAKDTSQKTKNISPMRHSHRSTTANTITQASTKKGGKSSDSTTSSSGSDDNIADTKEKHSHKTKVASKQINKSQPTSSVKSVFPTKLTAKQNDKNSLKPAISKMVSVQSSSSDSSSTSGEEEDQQSSSLKSKLPLKTKGVVTAAVTAPASKAQPETSSSDSDSSGSGSFTVKKPKINTEANRSFGEDGCKQPSASTFGLNMSFNDNVRGRGRGENPCWRGSRVRGCRGLVRGRGRGRSENTNFSYNYNNEYNKQQQLNEAAKNTSVIIQNPLDAPKKDYSKLPLLAAPPQVGEKIAFKLLELTESYTPELSDYKEGKIISWNPATKQLELELLSFSSVTKEPGKFDLVYESANGAEMIEYAVSQDGKLTESWNALIEPRLLVDLPNNELSSIPGTPSDVNTLVPGVNSL